MIVIAPRDLPTRYLPTRYRARPGARARMLGVLMLLAALIAMHGLSSAHTMFMPRSAGGPASMGQMAAPSAHMRTHTPARDDTRWSGVGSVATAPRTTAVMNHSECVATPRHLPTLSAPTLITVAAPGGAGTDRTTRTPSSAPTGDPPRPDLSRLCISRT